MEQNETLIRCRNDLVNVVGKLNKGDIVFEGKNDVVRNVVESLIKKINDKDYKFIVTVFMAINNYKLYEVLNIDPIYYAKELDKLFINLMNDINVSEVKIDE